MRRLLIPLLLTCLVLCAQQGALVHALAHGLGQAAVLQDAGHAATPASGGGAHCDKCFGFAHVAGAITVVIAPLQAQAEAFAPAARLALGAAMAPTLTTHSRDPPAAL